MSRAVPVRTCIGCRERAAKSDLLRLVVVGMPVRVVPDDDGRGHGRGAHLHPSPHCLDLATRRRAFSRAFRLEGALDIGAVKRWVEAHEPGPAAPRSDDETVRKRSTSS